MGTPTTKLAEDSKGRYRLDLGFKSMGDRSQPRFYLGTDRVQAEQRRAKLIKVWEIEARFTINDLASWSEQGLFIANCIRRGQYEIEVDPGPSKTNYEYFQRIVDLNREYREVGVVFLPTGGGVEAFEKGRQREAMMAHSLERAATKAAEDANEPLTLPSAARLHQCINAYADRSRSEYKGQSNWGHIYGLSVERLLDSIPDLPLDHFGLKEIEAMAGYWKSRPMVKGRNKPISVKTVSHQMKALKRFIKWLPKHYPWAKPEGWDDACKVNGKSLLTNAEKSARVHTKRSYTVAELATLYRYATPLERLLILLGINCGFGAGEIATLRYQEIQGDTISRVRTKWDIYGEWPLWADTMQALNWYIAKRRLITKDASGNDVTLRPDALAILTAKGQAMVRHTAKGSTVNHCAHIWAKLYARIIKDHPDFPKLSFNKLRKTGGNLIRKTSSGETASTYLAHGEVGDDDNLEAYADRDFSAVAGAVNRLYETIIKPNVLDAVPAPFEAPRKRHFLSLDTFEQLKALISAGERPEAIASRLGVSRATVYRHAGSIGNAAT